MPRIQRDISRLGVVACLAVACAAGVSCMKAPRQTELMAQANIRDISTAQLRTKVYGFAYHFSGVVEETATTIERDSSTRQVRINALMWKMHAIPASHKAALQHDPLAGLVDVWALSHQMRRFFVEGAGRDAFGDLQPVAVEASRRLEAEIEQLAKSIANDPEMPKARGALTDWVEEHPIESLLFVRESPTPMLADLVAGKNRGTFAVVGSLGESVTDISSRLAIYAETMPKQVRWQSQLAIEELTGEEQLEESILALRSLTALEAQVEEAMALVDDLPGLVATEREAILSALRAERAILTRFIEEQRLETLDFVGGERAVVLDTVHQERVATIEEIRQERIAVMEEIRTLSDALVDRALEGSEGLIDHLVWRLAQLFLALAVVAGFFGLIAVLLLRRPNRAAG